MQCLQDGYKGCNFKSLRCKCLCSLSLSSLPAGKEALPWFVTVCVSSQVGNGVSRRKDAAAHTGCMGQFSSHSGNTEISTPQLKQQLWSAWSRT